MTAPAMPRDLPAAGGRNPLDEALAALCEATCEAVEELEAADDGFDGCPLCGKPSYMHPKEDMAVLGHCPHGVDLDRDFCPEGCRV